MRDMNNVRDLVLLWPTTSDFASDIDENAATVRKWTQRNRIPASKILKISAAASERKIRGITAEKLLRVLS